MKLTRRRFLGNVGPATLAPFLPACGDTRDETRIGAAASADEAPAPELWPAASPDSPFRHGIASGDPLADAVVLWTRVTPAEGSSAPVEVEWRMALDPEFRDIVAEGAATAGADADYTVHVDVRRLSSGTTYYYQFRALGMSSVRGRTRTLPEGSVERMRFGVVSCANYPAGFFNVYAVLARADLDLVLHLGDYLYEYGNFTFGDGTAIGRVPDPNAETISLADYRRRHAQYKTDPDLQELHRQHPMAAIWDDHEIANNAFGAGAENHQSSYEGTFDTRKQGALRAYREWMPVRSQGDPRSYRSFGCGDLLDVVLLDTRHEGRDAQVDRCDVDALGDPARQLLGAEQEAWLEARLLESKARGARWRLLGQQVIFAPLLRSNSGCVQSADQWDGYAPSRTRLLDALQRGGIDDVIVLTGDAHSSWANDVPRSPFDAALYDPVTGRGSELVEFVTPAVSSRAAGGSASAILRSHPHVKFAEQTRQGYLLLDVTPERVLAEWHFVATVQERRPEAELGGMFQTLAGQPRVIAASAPSVPRGDAPPLAP